MTAVEEVLEVIDSMYEDPSISRNIRNTLIKIKEILTDDSKELGVRIDSAMQLLENLSADPNLSSYARTQIWNLTTLLEDVLK